MIAFLMAASFDLQACYNIAGVNHIVRRANGTSIVEADRIWANEVNQCRSGIMPKRLMPIIKL